MIKNIISPIQAWLLSQKRCVGCGFHLDEVKKTLKGQKVIVKCKCKRIFVFDRVSGKYRRAQLDEV
ncbi:MAG: hypothetical protein M1308_00620 [Actinobacteria bacterium]|nr:hypothetical protein [Actinomycetota bacterium]